jgi:hypothetical protein
VALRPPPRDAALAWLAAHGGRDQDWSAALTLAAGAPLAAVELDAGVVADLERDMNDGLRGLAADAVDVTLLAERWVKSNLGLRILWLENWITARVYARLGTAALPQNAERVRLPDGSLNPKIRGLFELLDALRDLRRAAPTAMNQQLALEAVLLGGRAALAA